MKEDSGEGSVPTTEPVTSDDIAAAFSASEPAPTGADSSPAPPAESASDAPPTAEPDADGPTPEKDAGPLPFERHKAILEKARADAKSAAEQEWKSKLGWAEQFEPDQVRQAVQLAQLLETDPQRAVAMLQAALASQQTDQPKDEPPPPDLKAEDGTLVYSAPQMQKLLEWQRRQLQSEIDSQYGPIRERVRHQELAQRAEHEATSMLTRARSEWPLFTDLEADIKQRMIADDRLQLHDAYLAAYREKGLKLQEERWRATYEGTVQRKADASSATTTSRPAGRRPVPLHERDIRDLVEEEYGRMSRG